MIRRSQLSVALGYATFFSASLAIIGAPWASGIDMLTSVFRPLTTLLIVAYALQRGFLTPAARIGVLAGLLLWLVGDVAMLWPKALFVAGLAFFLLADLAWLWACTRTQRLAAWWPPFVFYAIVGAAIVISAWPRTPLALRAPLIAYVAVVAALAAQTVVVWRAERGTERGPRGLALALGGALFLSSAGCVVIDRYTLALPLAQLWILAGAWGAQWCVASWLPPSRRLPSRVGATQSSVTS